MSETRIQKTGVPDIFEASDGRLTLSVPIQIKRRSGRKLVTLPSGETAPGQALGHSPQPPAAGAGRGHRWLALLTSGEARSIKEIAAREGVNGSYVGRMLNLTTLAPDYRRRHPGRRAARPHHTARSGDQSAGALG